MSTQEVVQTAPIQDGGILEIISSFMGTPEKLFEYLIKSLVVFLLLSIGILFGIDKKHFNLILGLVVLISLFLATAIVFKGVFKQEEEKSSNQATKKD